MTTATLTPAEQFFYDHAMFSVRVSEGETVAEGRTRCACELAVAEQWAREHHAVVEWEEDDIVAYDDEDGPFYGCTVIVGDVTKSLWGIAFKDYGGPAGDSYSRVVMAELANEVMRIVTERAELDAYMDDCYNPSPVTCYSIAKVLELCYWSSVGRLPGGYWEPMLVPPTAAS